MTPAEAKIIIEDFHKSIKDLRPNAIVQSSKELPYTSARIKYAHFVYGEYLIKDGFVLEAKTKIKEEILKSFVKLYQDLMESYGLIDSLFSEEPESINIEYRNYLKGLRNNTVTNFRIPNPFGEAEQVNEFHNFLGEAWFLEHHTNIFDGGPLGAFLYDGVRNKFTKEQNIKELIGLANTSLTRAVIFPDKKSNIESIFIR